MCIAAHPDDESLGCGATLARHAHAGDEVMVIIMADGVTSRDSIPKVSLERRRQCLAALKVLGVQHSAFGDWPDNRLDTVPMLILAKDIEHAVQRFQPAVVYTHHGCDLNVDHCRVAEATLVACRPQPGGSVKRVLHFETPSATDWQPMWRQWFQPNYFVDVEGFIGKKLEALGCYAEEIREWPHPRSVEGVVSLAKMCGCSVGLRAAEGFMVSRVIT